MQAELNREAASVRMRAPGQLKRSDRRFIVNQPAHLSTPAAPAEVWPARIRDISRRGMQFVLDRPFSPGPLVRVAWNGRDIHGTIRYQQQYGSEYRLGLELSASWDTLVSDILAQQAEELSAALTAAREASESKSRFLASISHEFRTPLNGIIGFSQLLHDGALGPLSAPQKECVADVLSCSSHLLTLISHVLDMTRIEAGKMDFHYESISLAEHVTAAVDSIRNMAAGKNIEVRLAIDSRLRNVRADAARLRQVALNFLSNAVKFTDPGGTITVDVRRHGEHAYRIVVEDNGAGIRSEDLPRLFSEFGQLGPSEKAQAGTGLGLVITKRIVEAQGGSVGVESVFGRGSRFFAVLPDSITS